MFSEVNETELKIAYEHYAKHKNAMRKYYESNKEKYRERAKKYYQSVRSDPEKYKIYLAKKREDIKEKREIKNI